MKRKRFSFKLWMGASLILIIGLAGALAPWLPIQDPNEMNLAIHHQSPSLAHWFGADENGGDIFSQIIYGARVSLTVGFCVVTVSVCLGLFIGSAAGYLGGWVDQLWMRLVDLLHAFPGFLLALSLVAVLGPSIRNLILAMCATGWTSYARLVRGEILHLKTKDFVLASIACGASSTRIIYRHIWPNLLGLLCVQATFGIAGAILTESGLSFLGLGAPADVPTWGALLNSGRRSLLEAPHISLFPGLFIMLTVLSFNFIGSSLSSYFDPTQTRR